MKKLDHINIIDVESTCWERGKQPEGQQSEIIEVGLTQLQLPELEVKHRTHWFIKPNASSVSQFCTDLTGITPSRVNAEGIGFDKVCKALRGVYDSLNQPWASFGDYDKNMFRKDCKRHHIEYPFGSRHINIKTLAAIMCGQSKEMGMTGVLSHLGLQMKGEHHSAADDSYNIARIFQDLMMEGGLEEE